MKTRHIQIERAKRMMHKRRLMERWARGQDLIRISPLKAGRTNGRDCDFFALYSNIDEMREAMRGAITYEEARKNGWR